MGVIQDYIDAKHGDGGPSSGRFEPDPSRVHASHLSDCQRKRYWKHERGHTADPSVYFELGNVYEQLYGAALAYEHDPDVDESVLKRHDPWVVAEGSTHVIQDVDVEIEENGHRIVGECDWVVLDEPRDLRRVEVGPGGSRTEVAGSLEREFRGVSKVVETKTKADQSALDWLARDGPVEKHVFQVFPYGYALDCDMELAYMGRADWSELVVPVEFDEARWTDMRLRAARHASNYGSDELPPTTPLNSDECHWCPFENECRREGGSAW